MASKERDWDKRWNVSKGEFTSSLSRSRVGNAIPDWDGLGIQFCYIDLLDGNYGKLCFSPSFIDLSLSFHGSTQIDGSSNLDV